MVDIEVDHRNRWHSIFCGGCFGRPAKQTPFFSQKLCEEQFIELNGHSDFSMFYDRPFKIVSDRLDVIEYEDSRDLVR
jgi:hypothetical protein